MTITYYYKITPGYILGYANLSYKQVGGQYAIQSVDIMLGVKGLSITGIANLVPPSTLNLYALTISHGWLSTGTFSEHNGNLTLTLPAYIPYKKAP